MGRDYALAHLRCPIGLQVRRADAVGDRIFVEGNSAAGARRGLWRRDGLRLVSDHALDLAGRGLHALLPALPRRHGDRARHRFAIVQARGRDRLDRHGDRRRLERRARLHRTSGPGISLMQEFVGLAYFAEIPAVIFDVQRGGPSTGMPTRTQQSDMLACAYASHGDTKHVLLFPEDPHECFEIGALAFDLADRLQTPVFVMLDLDIGMNEWLCRPFAWDDSAPHRPRQGDDRRGAARPARTSAATSTWTATASPIRTYPGTHPTRGALLHPRHLAATATPATARRARSTSTTCSGCCASSRPPRRWCPRRCARGRAAPTPYRRDLFRLDQPGDGRGAASASTAQGVAHRRCCACAAFRSATR